MEVSCPSCPARYAVPDGRVQGRKVRIRCKRCGGAIIVDGTSASASKPHTPHANSTPDAPQHNKAHQAKAAPVSPGPIPKPTVDTPKAPRPEPTAAPQHDVTKTEPTSSPAQDFSPPRKKRPSSSSWTALKTGQGGRWTEPASTDSRIPTAQATSHRVHALWREKTSSGTRSLTTEAIVDLFAQGAIGPTTPLARDPHGVFEPLHAHGEIVAALQDAGLSLEDASDPTQVNANDSGWLEPGQWAEPEDEDVGFEDVTVAMRPNQAAELLRAAQGKNAPQVPAPDSLVESKPEIPADSAKPPSPTAQPATPSQDSFRELTNYADDERTLLVQSDELFNDSNDERTLAVNPQELLRQSEEDLFEDETTHAQVNPFDFSDAATEVLPSTPSIEQALQRNAAPLLDGPPVPKPVDRSGPVDEPPQAASAPAHAKPQASPSSRKAFLWLALLLLVTAGLAAAAYHFKQPAILFSTLGIQ